LIIIQVTWVSDRSTEVTKKFYQRIADEIHAKQDVRKQDIWISLVDSGREDWSFGNGEMQCALSEGQLPTERDLPAPAVTVGSRQEKSIAFVDLRRGPCRTR
jgi:hypothetical protein